MDEENTHDPHDNFENDEEEENPLIVPPIVPPIVLPIVSPIVPPIVNIDALANIRDNVVAKATLRIYINDNIPFLKWCLERSGDNDWLMEYGRQSIVMLVVNKEDESVHKHKVRMHTDLQALLRNAHSHPIVKIDKITSEGYMQYILNPRHPGNGGYLSKSSYGNKRASLNHLFRVHNRVGIPPDFCKQLTNLFKGFFRSLAQNNPIRVPETDDAPGEQEGIPEPKFRGEGKAAMSVALYRAICGWLLDFGTTDGLFAHCFLVLTWNLACRSQNTSLIQIKHIVWASCFDSFQVYFQHSKTDQLGEEAKYPRHIYANPFSPSICPVLALTLYFSACFNCPLNPDSYLFPGKDQEHRFSRLLTRLLDVHEGDLQTFGYARNEIGTHSIRKGAVSYLSATPGGPQAASVCVHAGWTMGKVRDIYMHYVESGDQFVGRCLAVLPLMSSEFACSPPYFLNTATIEDNNWIEAVRVTQFPMASHIPQYGLLTRMCLATLLHHRGWITENFSENHIVHFCSTALRRDDVSRRLSENALVVVTYPWNDKASHSYSGVPPYVSVMQELSLLRHDQLNLIDNFVIKVKVALDEFGIDGDRITLNNLRQILDQFRNDITTQLQNIGGGPGGNAPVITDGDGEEAGQRYKIYYYAGKMKRVPENWRFPRCGVFDAWRQWWIGDHI